MPRVPLPPFMAPCRFGSLNADAIESAHRAHCAACRRGMHPSCYGSRVVQWARYGYKPAMRRAPRPHRARRPKADSPMQAVLDEALSGELERCEVERHRGPAPRVSSSRFVVQRKKFKVPARGATASLDAPEAFTVKNRVVQDLSRSGVNDAVEPWSSSSATPQSTN